MKLAIIGSRSITNIDISPHIPADVDMIISGGAKGIDALAEAYADKNRLSKVILRPNYKRYGKGAPIIRNREIVDMADFVLVFWDGKSKGTQSTLSYGEQQGKCLQNTLFC